MKIATKDTTTIKIRHVSTNVHEELFAISDNLGIPLASILRGKIKSIRTMDEMTQCFHQRNKGKTVEIRITSVPLEIKTVIKENAKAFNLYENAYLKCWLSQVAASFPPHLKRPPRLY